MVSDNMSASRIPEILLGVKNPIPLEIKFSWLRLNTVLDPGSLHGFQPESCRPVATCAFSKKRTNIRRKRRFIVSAAFLIGFSFR
jgi:hypothetical protein